MAGRCPRVARTARVTQGCRGSVPVANVRLFMSAVIFIWALVVGACATMALPHLLIGIKHRARQNLLFAVAALAVAGIAVGELAIMHSRTTEEIGRVMQWTHLPVFFLYLGIIGFVRAYFGTGRLWLGSAAIGLRLVTLVINFAFPPNLNFREITGLGHIHFLGETVAVPEGVASPWTHLGELSSLLMLAYVIDASLALWRRGKLENRRRAAVVGGSITLFILAAAGVSALIHANVIRAPYLISFPFVGVIMAMCVELSYDILRAAQTARRLHVSEGALRESETRMSLAASAANVGLWVWDIPRDDIWLTEKGRELFGFEKSELIDLNRFLRVVHEDDRARMQQLLADSLVRGGEYESEYRITRGDGKTIWATGYGHVEFDEQGKASRLRGVTRDISEAKEAARSLLESQARLSAAIEVAALGLFEMRVGTNAVYFDDGVRSILGIPSGQDSRTFDFWSEHIHPDDRDRILELLRQLVDGELERTAAEYRFHHPERGLVWLHELAQVMERDSNKRATVLIGVFQDITERKQTELDHQLQSVELARVGRVALMGELAASLAHEVNNPLGAMVTNANAGQRLLAHGQLQTDELRELLADIVADGHRARAVIQGIRNMVRKGDASYSPVAIRDVIRDLLRIVRADAIARNTSLIAEVHPNPGVVMADRVQLLQVLLNLTLNAFEALSVLRPDARRVTIRADLVENGSICVTVRDTGPGFPDGIVDRLFEPFFSTKAEGTGMGLAIARSIIEAHGGTLSGESCADGGARFTICLPEAEQVTSQAAYAEASARSGTDDS